MPKVKYTARIEASGTHQEIKEFLDKAIEEALDKRELLTKKIELISESIILNDIGEFNPYGKSRQKNYESQRKQGKELHQV